MERKPPFDSLSEASDKFHELVSQFKWEASNSVNTLELCWSVDRDRVDPDRLVDDIILDFGFGFDADWWGRDKFLGFSDGDWLYMLPKAGLQQRKKGASPVLLLYRIDWNHVTMLDSYKLRFERK